MAPRGIWPGSTAGDQIDVVIIAIPSAGELVFGHIAELARRSGAKVLTMPSIGSLQRGHASARMLRGVLDTDILGRSVVVPDIEVCRVLVTCVAGSIGSEVARCRRPTGERGTNLPCQFRTQVPWQCG